MKVRIYYNYSPIRIVYPIDGEIKSDLIGDFANIDSADLPNGNRNQWKWDSDKKKVVIDRAKVDALKAKKDAEDALLAGIKLKLGLTDDEWEVLKKLVKK